MNNTVNQNGARGGYERTEGIVINGLRCSVFAEYGFAGITGFGATRDQNQTGKVCSSKPLFSFRTREAAIADLTKSLGGRV